MRKSLIALATLAAFAQFASAQDTGSWIVRARAVDLMSDNGNAGALKSTLTAVTTLPNPSASINDKWLPEVDITYFFTPNIAAELILTVPQSQTVYANFTGGKAAIGTFKHLPPVLTAQYHFTNVPMFRPYVGLGVNYTRISDVNVTVPAAVTSSEPQAAIPLDLSRNSFGLAAQLGADVPLGGGWLLNLDIKKVQIGADVKVKGGPKIGEFNVDPLLVSIGVGKRF